MSKRQASPDIVAGPSIAPKRARAHVAPRAPTLDSWLKPDDAPPLLASSPHLHAGNSTFIGFTFAFVPPAHVRSVASLTKEAKRVVKELDVVRLVGDELLARNEGAFGDGQGRAPGRSARPRAREPDHRMWAVRTLGLAEGKDGTGGEGDYQLLEAWDDDGERYGGERVLRVLKDEGGVDVLTIVCRWFGGDMLGPARFHHIGITAQHSLTELQRLVSLRDLRADLVRLDGEIAALRVAVAAAGSGDGEAGGSGSTAPPAAEGTATPTASQSQSRPLSQSQTPSQSQTQTYDNIEDIPRLERLVKAREMTKANLEKRVGSLMGAP